MLLSPTPTVSHTHGTPFVKQLIIAKRITHRLKDTVSSNEVKTLIFERPANKLQRLLNERTKHFGLKAHAYWSERFFQFSFANINQAQAYHDVAE